MQPELFLKNLRECGFEFFTGVPDSLLKDFCAHIDDHLPLERHIITANEGNAVALAAGYHMATGQNALVYMQNSGLGNAINPLTSLVHGDVYRIPMLLLIGWRGEPGFQDEPQHVAQGRMTLSQLDLLELPYRVIDKDSDPQEVASWARDMLRETGSTVALVARSGTFSSYSPKAREARPFKLGREDAIRQILKLSADWPVISTTGKTSREVFEIRAEQGQDQRDFLTVGGMGHTASIALGVALGRPDKRIICLDGDGSLLMHLGAMPIIGSIKPGNFLHILLNNSAHESVGGQPTVGDKTDFESIARASGYGAYRSAATADELESAWREIEKLDGPILLEVKIALGSRADLGRPTSTPEQNKLNFMKWVAK